MRTIAGLIFVVALGSCGLLEQDPDAWKVPPDAYKFVSTVNLADRSFGISFESKSLRPICMPIANWPTGIGVTDMSASGYAYAMLNGQRYDANGGPRGYCTGNCYNLVKPRQTITGRIPFSEFELPENLGSEPDLRLEMYVAPYRCDR